MLDGTGRDRNLATRIVPEPVTMESLSMNKLEIQSWKIIIVGNYQYQSYFSRVLFQGCLRY